MIHLRPVHIPFQLRTYTRTFAKRAAVLYPHMIKKVKPPQHEDMQLLFTNLWHSYADWDSWSDSYMKEVARYLLGAKGLQVPYCWEWIIPGDL